MCEKVDFYSSGKKISSKFVGDKILKILQKQDKNFRKFCEKWLKMFCKGEKEIFDFEQNTKKFIKFVIISRK